MDQFLAIDVTDEHLCSVAFVSDGAPDLLVAAAWAINGYRNSAYQDETVDDPMETGIDDE
ncbi:hypothetical protein [Acidithiobacillus sulfuriphilus]|uniref:hypothetical protein n=1 Tax=Acidithiobacillus sulfuriphilus TaxID=1867749 RepID=UPI003F639829